MASDEVKTPLATYRIQLGPGMSFDRLTGLLPYFGRLGISHLYLSPCLTAAEGSHHGYDVADPSEVNPDLGGREGFVRLCRAAAAGGFGLVVDVVPNHMTTAGRRNRWWWDVLARGPRSRYAGFFDIRWDSPEPSLRGKVLLPVLGDELVPCLERGELRLCREGDELTVRYVEHEFPVSAESLGELLPGPGGGPAAGAMEEGAPRPVPPAAIRAINADPVRLGAFLDLQHYRLAFWRRANREINYRRFFDLPQLAGVRVEREEVFAATHQVVFDWVASGEVDGLRIDHPDGLQDPTAYLQRLQRAVPRAWVVVEKILEPGEALPPEWPVAGTTGYEFLNRVNGLYVDPSSERALTDFYAEFTGHADGCRDIVRALKRLALTRLFESELTHLGVLLCEGLAHPPGTAGIRPEDAVRALTEVIVGFPVYRTYIRPEAGHVAARDREIVREAVGAARRNRPEIPPAAAAGIEELLLLRRTGDAAGEFVHRFQQLTGPVMAKGVEDTAFYRFNRLIALNEVGGDPGEFGVSLAAFHAFCRRIQGDWPRTMLASATHDTKRGEDTRVRIGLLSEIPERWTAAVRRWSRMNAGFHRNGFPDANTEYFLYQTLAGAWPIGEERLVPAMRKAAREAKVHTSWLAPDPVFEEALERFVKAILGHADFTADLSAFLAPLTAPAIATSLSQTLIKLTAPGVPDIYQGAELWDLNLVDPDNRRPVDFDLRRRLLDETGTMDAGAVMARPDEGLPKLFLIQRVLAARRRLAEAFGARGGYHPLWAAGDRAQHLVAFIRGGRALALAPRLAVRLAADWKDTTLDLPAGAWTDVFTGGRFRGGRQRLASLLRLFPVGLLLRDGGPISA